MMHCLKSIRARFASLTIGLGGIVMALTLLVAGGCDLREVVEVERPFFKEPPTEALGFLGYDDEDEKLTVCGNCHVGQQSEWAGTRHAGAWETLEASGHALALCENCHTVNANGNPTTEPAGWASTRDSRYHDVQCESCHGPGNVHVSNPDIDGSHPIASLDVGDLSNLDNATSCAQCHQGTHHPFAEEWAQSGHATVVTAAADREACVGCHRGQGALEAWGVTDNYAEKNAPEHLAITCGVCHDPHNAQYGGQLRRPIRTTSIEQHLCASCHNRRTVPDPNSSHGLEPHAPESALLLGEAGWFPPNAEIDVGEILATHGTDRNERLCATCHVNSFTVTDKVTGDFVFQATGHLFTAIPCLDADGIPTPGECGLTPAERSFKGCTEAGCHASEDNASMALNNAAGRIQGYADELLDALTLVDPNLEDAGGAIDPADPTFTVAEGALFNYHLATFGNDVRGSTVHNPFLTEALLIASLDAVQEAYAAGKTVAAKNWKAELQQLKARLPHP
jgi:predicted CXXCH cytochrome family protein